MEILDTSETSDTVAAAFEPKTIRIEHTDAARLAQMIQQVYRSYFTGAPAGSNFAPQLTVDQTTNSLIIKAPPQIVDTVTRFAKSLDTAAVEDPSRKLRVIPLKNANAARVQQALNAMMRGGTGAYGTSIYRPGGYAPSSSIYRPR